MIQNIGDFFSGIGNWFQNLPWNTVSLSDWIQIGIGLLSFVVPVALTVVIYKMQSQHEREIEKLKQIQQQEELSNQAKIFLIENSKECDYLPWCYIANSVARHNHHAREIYKRFCGSPDKLQYAILEEAGFQITQFPPNIEMQKWISYLKTDIQLYGLGRDFFDAEGKYLYYGFHFFYNKPWPDSTHDELFETIKPKSCRNNKVNLLEYIEEYVSCVYNASPETELEAIPTPPIDYLLQVINFEAVEDQSIIFMWIMELVTDICIVLCHPNAHKQGINPRYSTYVAAPVMTFEDKYYDMIQWMSYVYSEFDV